MDGRQEGKKSEDLPVNSSPYTQYKDLEDYKQQGYGTQGHQQPQPGRGAAASTDAPTSGGGTLPSQPQKGSDPAGAPATATDTVNQYGVP
ncbi:uncharacterized protein LOC112513023 [Cynara cardunculus var. scolymus]|uniref:Late embryogenesis abundant protein, LEA-18 n=1 Tax=Cynara cardunculus var. scolymus TaxID=59895 RepID=A0A124SFB2_CYNCS|nr:uncharacterized protein LOC112513023 [Cynara cardunculus var. scolymus]KVI02717.1 Late embryogenesis abundant protein, LEA-18 [Cynara cardunculus var. scolymus]